MPNLPDANDPVAKPVAARPAFSGEATVMLWAWLLIALGLLLLVAEIFIPSGGIIFICALVCIVIGVTIIFFTPESEGGGVTMGLLSLLVVMLVIPGVVAVGFHFWPKTSVGKHLFLPEPSAEEDGAALPAAHEHEQYLGQVGRTLTPHTPSGITLIQGRRIDTKTEGMYVDAGRWVRVVDVRPGQVTVRPLDASELKQLPDDLANA